MPRRATSTDQTSPRSRPPSRSRRPGLYLGVAAVGSVVVHGVFGGGPAPEASAVAEAQPASVAQQLGLTARTGALDEPVDLQPLQDMAASRSTREDAEVAAQQVQAAADQAVLDQQAAEAAAAEAAAAEAAAAAAAAEQAAAQAAQAPAQAEQTQAGAAVPSAAASAASTAVTASARISNTAGPVSSGVQAAANAVVSNVPGAGGITLGGTRASATDPGGHPSGKALDYMVLGNAGLGDAIVRYHRDHWAELGVEYLIWQQRMLSSPNGSWVPMEDRGGTTANHYDHVHVNYR